MSILFRPLLRYADFQGRASRREYFGFMLLQYMVAGLVLALMVGAIRGEDGHGGGLGGGLAVLALSGGLGLLGLMAVGLLIPNWAVLTRRLHDSGKSAWCLMLLAPHVLTVVLAAGAFGGAIQHAVQGVDAREAAPAFLAALGGAGVMALLAQVCGLILFILTLLPGSAGDNRFGPDPRRLTLAPSAGLAPASGLALDEARLEALFEEARRGLSQSAVAASPVSGTTWGTASGPPSGHGHGAIAGWERPAYDPGVAPSRPFGKRV
ncbi:DUF805 domain-containing protein [Brevundimonas sp. SORGH_AS_0993]|uniref:DUF805 domain-containing protein n=1 Tax=Brevundimonas sp. SORGH_AS_0993 TaxID=3041794 RepID=UPI0027821004|nr:DUF805 domain-containing protein [Brevundimonas sp. SORGH_AS_0993]MDQ1155250.1 uncharacterized membrane protein YhaH (DUF805 family) [Brevundimonas sp. SORGH_AS_0993]